MKISRFFALMIALFAIVPVAAAQTGGEESPGGLLPNEEAISADTPLTVHLAGEAPVSLIYEAPADETVTISARSLEAAGVLDPILTLLDEKGAVIALNDDHGTSRADLTIRDALIADLYLPAAGRYIIEVSAYAGGGSPIDGDVEIALTTGEAQQEAPTATPTPATNEGGDQVIEDVVPDGDSYSTPFEAAEGDVVTITVRSTNGALDPKVALIDSSGTIIAENDDHETPDERLGSFDSQIVDFAIPQTDTYTIEITGFRGVGGAFELTISFGDEQNVVRATPAVEVTPSQEDDTQTVEGSIEPNGTYSTMLDAEAGDVYTITALAMDGIFDPRVIVYLNDDYIIDSDDYGTNDPALQVTDARIYNLIIKESGRYEVLVRGYADSAGAFRLIMEQVATDAPTGLPEEQVELGSIAAGEIYTMNFEALEGDYVTITARGLTEGFDAYLSLMDESGNVLLDNDDNGTNIATLSFRDAQIPNYRIPQNGIYTIQVSSFGDRGGAFGLTIATLR